MNLTYPINQQHFVNSYPTYFNGSNIIQPNNPQFIPQNPFTIDSFQLRQDQLKNVCFNQTNTIQNQNINSNRNLNVTVIAEPSNGDYIEDYPSHLLAIEKQNMNKKAQNSKTDSSDNYLKYDLETAMHTDEFISKDFDIENSKTKKPELKKTNSYEYISEPLDEITKMQTNGSQETKFSDLNPF
jgi:hypothetical protein